VYGTKIRHNDQLGSAEIAILTGLAATAAPNGRTDNGLSIGVQIMGGYLEDHDDCLCRPY